MEITNQHKLKAAKRELGIRKRVYPRWVEEGRVTAEAAAREIEIMEAIVKDYELAVSCQNELFASQ